LVPEGVAFVRAAGVGLDIAERVNAVRQQHLHTHLADDEIAVRLGVVAVERRGAAAAVGTLFARRASDGEVHILQVDWDEGEGEGEGEVTR